VGPISQVWLQAVGIDLREALRQAGVMATVCMIRAAGYPANFNLVLALQWTLLDCDWRAYPMQCATICGSKGP